ncbi:hypothetical protein K0U07_02805 [bacterium]|nr:hypothetical protein [bacterium]
MDPMGESNKGQQGSPISGGGGSKDSAESKGDSQTRAKTKQVFGRTCVPVRQHRSTPSRLYVHGDQDERMQKEQDFLQGAANHVLQNLQRHQSSKDRLKTVKNAVDILGKIEGRERQVAVEKKTTGFGASLWKGVKGMFRSRQQKMQAKEAEARMVAEAQLYELKNQLEEELRSIFDTTKGDINREFSMLGLEGRALDSSNAQDVRREVEKQHREKTVSRTEDKLVKHFEMMDALAGALHSDDEGVTEQREFFEAFKAAEGLTTRERIEQQPRMNMLDQFDIDLPDVDDE